MSTDYYGRIEQQRGPHPSEQMLAAIARGLHLSLDERDHLFRLAGHAAPHRSLRNEHISPGMMRILDRLEDTPAQVLTRLGEPLRQTRPATALLGDHTGHTGMARSVGYRWFTDPQSRLIYPAEDHPKHGRIYASALREVYAKEGPGSRAGQMVEALLAAGGDFAEIWAEHQVGLLYSDTKRILHPELGLIEVYCQTLQDPDQSQTLLVYTAVPGSESYEKLQLLSVIGDQRI
jgi:hypothetical protein